MTDQAIFYFLDEGPQEWHGGRMMLSTNPAAKGGKVLGTYSRKLAAKDATEPTQFVSASGIPDLDGIKAPTRDELKQKIIAALS